MTAKLKIIAAIYAAAATLSACASASDGPALTWTGGDPTHLKPDQAACHKQADSVDVYQANAYSDSRYGAATAMAAAIDRDDPLHGHNSGARLAAFMTCMGDKGWKSE